MVYVHIAQAGLPKLLEKVSPYDIYNMDETGLNYRTLPKRTLGTEQRKGYVAARLCCYVAAPFFSACHAADGISLSAGARAD